MNTMFCIAWCIPGPSKGLEFLKEVRCVLCFPQSVVPGIGPWKVINQHVLAEYINLSFLGN